MNLRGKKSSRAELDFIVPIKSTTRTQGEKGGVESIRIYKASQNIRIINVFLESLLSESFSSLVCPPTLC